MEGDIEMSASKEKGHIGGSFDDYLKDEGTYWETEALAIKRVLAWQIGEAMALEGLTKTTMARRMGTSRSQLDRLLDPKTDDVKLTTLARAAQAVGRSLKLELA